MQIRCGRCGAENESDFSAQPKRCHSCGHDIQIDDGGFGLEELAGLELGSTDFEDLSSGEELGSRTGNAQPFDLSALMDQAEMDTLGGSSFSFEQDNFDDQILGMGEEEPTRVVNTDIADVVRAFGSTAAGVGWRVKSERGLIYELMSIDAVVAWLGGKSDIQGILISEADGEFKPISAYPKLAQRLGISDQRPPSAAPKPTTPEAPALTLSRERSKPKRSPALSRDQGNKEQKKAAPRSRVQEARKRVENPIGMGFLLALSLACLILGLGLVMGGVKMGLFSLPESQSLGQVHPSKGFKRALRALNEKKYTAATELFRELSQREKDPQIYRYQALALYQTDRKIEAEKALSEYRRALLRAEQHGR